VAILPLTAQTNRSGLWNLPQEVSQMRPRQADLQEMSLKGASLRRLSGKVSVL
jgi:hypothetical protein